MRKRHRSADVELDQLVDDVAKVLGPTVYAKAGPGRRATLDGLWRLVIEALHAAAGVAGDPSTPMLELLTRIRAAGARTVPDGMPDGAGLDGVREVVAAMRTAATSQQLLEEVPESIARLGFDRVLVSRIVDSVWVPETMFVRHDPRWAREIMAAGHDEPTALDGVLVETAVARRGASLVVHEVQSNPRVHRPIAVISRSDNYGVVPVSVGGRVAAMIHADLYYQRRPVHPDQCLLLGVVAEALGASLERIAVLERVAAARRESERAWAEVDAPARIDLPPPEQGRKIDVELTAREVEVVRLMAAGESNYRIARVLHISEGTVKTHVKHVLRKLGAVNRADAVARWLRR